MFETRRYLTQFSSTRTPHHLTDVLVIGSGIAGLRSAIAAAQYCQVLLICKGDLFESNTRFAQGGIAASLPDSQSKESHIQDTIRVGCGLCNEEAIKHMIEMSPQTIRELMEWGVEFDRQEGRLAYAKEGGHSQARILHSKGDCTGEAIIAPLVAKVRDNPAIRIFENCFAIDLITVDDRCVGVVTFHEKYGHQFIWAKETILASGGCGRIYRETTNPEVATGDGHAMAFRAGAWLQDMEMVQFHPTTLYVAGASRALISEAVRGEGGRLVDKTGRRFMPDYHPQAELAPRDVVSRAILSHMVETQTTSVYLDVRHFDQGKFRRRFPWIDQLCVDFDIDPQNDLIPVRPSAHYMIGGVCVDRSGQSSVPGLWACGEVAATGVHGANRLASNSLLEGFVFGKITGESAGSAAAADPKQMRPFPVVHTPSPSRRIQLDLVDVSHSLKSLMWRNAGILRTGTHLTDTLELTQIWGKYVLDKLFDARFGWEVQNMLTLSLLIATAALNRTESRGVHYRTDFPEVNDCEWEVHLQLQRTAQGAQLLSKPVS